MSEIWNSHGKENENNVSVQFGTWSKIKFNKLYLKASYTTSTYMKIWTIPNELNTVWSRSTCAPDDYSTESYK
jgi:hypothetical protein